MASNFRKKKKSDKEREGDEEEQEGEEPPPFAYPSSLPHAPSLSPALQDSLIGLFRDDTRRTPATNLAYFTDISSFWQRLEQVLPPFPPSPLPLFTPKAFQQWLLETPQAQVAFLQLRQEMKNGSKGFRSRSFHGLGAILAALRLRVSGHREGSPQRLLCVSKEETSQRKERKARGKGEIDKRDEVKEGGGGRKRREEEQLSVLQRLLERIPSCTPSLRHWIVRQFRHDKSQRIAYAQLAHLARKILELQPFLPSSPASTPAFLQAALLQPAAQKALLSFYLKAEERKTGPESVLSALIHLFVIFRLEVCTKTQGRMLVVVGGGEEGGAGEKWEEWREWGKSEEAGDEEEEEEDEEGEEGEEEWREGGEEEEKEEKEEGGGGGGGG